MVVKFDWVEFGYTEKQSDQVNQCYNAISETFRRKCVCKTCPYCINLETAGVVLYFLTQHKGHDTELLEVQQL